MPGDAASRRRAGATPTACGYQAKAPTPAFRVADFIERARAAVSRYLPVVNPVLSRQQASAAHRPDHEVAGVSRGAGEVIGPSRPLRGALEPRHARAAQAGIALQRGRDGRTAFILGFAEAFGEHGGVLDRHSRAL